MPRQMDLYASLSKKNIDATSNLSDEELNLLESISHLQEKEAKAIKDIIKRYLGEHPPLRKSDPKKSRMKKNAESNEHVPYNGQQTPLGTEFDTDNLPVELCRIICKFVSLINKNG